MSVDIFTLGEQSHIDEIISEIINARCGKPLHLAESDIEKICVRSREIFLKEPMLLKLAAPIKVCGDLQGQFIDLLNFFDHGGHPPAAKYLFLGNYVDHDKQSFETISLLLAYKVRFPDHIFLLHGNHESGTIERIYGFYDECKRRYSTKLWRTFVDCFGCMPVAAIIADKIFCCPGGITSRLHSVGQIARLPRPYMVPDKGLLSDLLWSEPNSKIVGWSDNDCDTFGVEIIEKFLKRHKFDLICRSHQIVDEGYKFFANRQLLTIFSAPNYSSEYENAGAMMNVDESLQCSFFALRPSRKICIRKIHSTL
ncbi:serine/threonine-protein phosphatase alpha-2 isoform-like [Scaptodrosophila lebanonensis]|uniref:protein-serine/threonine phosphatase n=1 Tax=Drosophila lebanonensis TaxID=7225 RepID=A0A6J2T274_DROLE|nr:serine/threonine-protein phosphatase alpha-2 isoform-like [Scaptodrosophila lebanonensis]